MPLLPGLCSITFRKLLPAEICDRAARAGLACIEWGGDIHAPPGDLARAKEVRALTQKAGLRISSYGSYFKVGEQSVAEFGGVLATARELGAPVIRLWAGGKGSADASPEYRRRVIADALRFADQTGDAGIRIAFEYHGGTLTDTHESAVALYADLPDPEIQAYWQPAVGWTGEQRLASLQALLPRLANLHVFHWDAARMRRSLAEGEDEWRRYFAAAAATGREHAALLEFVRDDDPAVLAGEATVLRRLCGW